ncbi:Adhesion G-protein coupled receptor G7 [Apodemus speciosus]|uniref:Adhesion G-protein coupled receptor G7 n=1 Tax=Apodemus speciosus TaxID=105296 RepID=A0ABQ0FM54_APOSI
MLYNLAQCFGFTMRSCRSCNVRVLVAIVCGLLTGVVLGLGIWRMVVRINRGIFVSVSSTPVQFCRNGGTWQNGRCICTEEWKGLRCTIANFCNNSTYGTFTFGIIPVGRYGPSLQTCPPDTVNAGSPQATRLCGVSELGVIEAQNVTIGNCEVNLESLEKQIAQALTELLSGTIAKRRRATAEFKIHNESHHLPYHRWPEYEWVGNEKQDVQINDNTTNFENISTEAQILTANASKLTPQNITSATTVVAQIFNKTGETEIQAKKLAVTTVSQILDASADVFQKAAEIDTRNSFNIKLECIRLIQQMESYSFSLGDETVVEPNIAIQSVSLVNGTRPSVLFSVQKGSSNSLVSGRTSINKTADGLNPDGQTELQILFNTGKDKTSCGFVVYQNHKLFQSKTFTATSDFSQKIISSKASGSQEIQNDVSVKMVFNPTVIRQRRTPASLLCLCLLEFFKKRLGHTWLPKRHEHHRVPRLPMQPHNQFRCIDGFKKDYKYPESLDVLSNIGCALSIAGLALTILFQILTRKIRKTSVTWVLVSLCTSMLIFNLLFVFGIENSNKNLKTSDSDIDTNPENNKIPETDTVETPNPSCTAIAALLHYFLLGTFTWNGLSATQLYFLLIRTMKPLPPHFIVIISLVGWGVPAIIVGITIGIIYALSGNKTYWELDYRQEEICWLAIPKNNDFARSPLLWSFILPVTIILITNIAIFVTITVKVLWKNNQNLTSTKKVSSFKKVLSTLSIAVVFGVTWIFAYAMLINNDDIRIVFSYIFCLFNTTQAVKNVTLVDHFVYLMGVKHPIVKFCSFRGSDHKVRTPGDRMLLQVSKWGNGITMLEVEEMGNTPSTNLFPLRKLKIVKIREQTCTAAMSSNGPLNRHWAQHCVYLKGVHVHSSCELLDCKYSFSTQFEQKQSEAKAFDGPTDTARKDVQYAQIHTLPERTIYAAGAVCSD